RDDLALAWMQGIFYRNRFYATRAQHPADERQSLGEAGREDYMFRLYLHTAHASKIAGEFLAQREHTMRVAVGQSSIGYNLQDLASGRSPGWTREKSWIRHAGTKIIARLIGRRQYRSRWTLYSHHAGDACS